MTGLLGLFGVAAGCGGAGARPVTRPAISVVTGLYPLAQAAEEAGGAAVAVTDVVPAGANPRTYRLTPAQVAEVRDAGAVLLIGGGFQPSLEQAAAGRPDVLNLGAVLGTTDPYVWLDPPVMHRAVTAIADALAAADPASASGFKRNAAAYADQVDSTGIDYESTLSVCPRRTIITPDGAFSGLARRYGLVDQVVGTEANPPAQAVAAAAQAARAAQATTAFTEPFVPSGTVTAVATAAHLKVRSLDPLTGPPAGGWPRGANYVRLMEANLGALNSALGCPDAGTGS